MEMFGGYIMHVDGQVQILVQGIFLLTGFLQVVLQLERDERRQVLMTLMGSGWATLLWNPMVDRIIAHFVLLQTLFFFRPFIWNSGFLFLQQVSKSFLVDVKGRTGICIQLFFCGLVASWDIIFHALHDKFYFSSMYLFIFLWALPVPRGVKSNQCFLILLLSLWVEK
jgi:hypothetical protein